MKYKAYTSYTKTFSVKDLEMTLELIFATNYERFLNCDALSEAGIDPLGLARQMDQVYLENIRNSVAARVRKAEMKGTPLPTQEDVDALAQAYDFSGARASSEESMSPDEKIRLGEIRKYIRRALVGGVFNQNGFYVVRVQTAKEAAEMAEKAQAGEDASVPRGTLPLDEFDALVRAAFDRAFVEVTDARGYSHAINFAEEAWQKWLEPAEVEAARIIERNSVRAVAPAPITLDM